MNFDDQILHLLGTSPDVRYSAPQVGRMLSPELSGQDPNWVAPSLELLAMQRRIRFDAGSFWFATCS